MNEFYLLDYSDLLLRNYQDGQENKIAYKLEIRMNLFNHSQLKPKCLFIIYNIISAYLLCFKSNMLVC